MSKKQKIIAYVVSGACLAALSAFFIAFGPLKSDKLPLAAAILSTLMFAALGVVFVFRWIKDWTPGSDLTDYGQAKSGASALETLVVSAVTLLVQFLCFVLLAFLIKAFKNEGTLMQGLEAYMFKSDCTHYIHIARDFYVNDDPVEKLNLVFLPGYPMLVRLFRHLIKNDLAAAVTVSNVCLNAGSCYLHRLLRLDFDKKEAARIMAYFTLIPGMFFLVTPMSESVFLLMSAACIYYTRKHKYVPAMLFGIYATFTRTLGLALLAPVIYEFIGSIIHRPPCGKKEVVKTVLKGLSCIAIVLGFVSYLFINKLVTGSFFTFTEYQKSNWHQSFSWFFNTPAYLTKYGITYWKAGSKGFFGRVIPNLAAIFVSLALMIYANFKKIRPSYTAYYILTFIMSVGTTWLLSLPRYLTVTFPLAIAWSSVPVKKHPVSECAVAGILGAFSLLYMVMFVMRWEVW